jgi:hypothetical protein
MTKQSNSLQFQMGTKALKEGKHINPFTKPAPLRWRRDWQAGYDAAKAASTKGLM